LVKIKKLFKKGKEELEKISQGDFNFLLCGVTFEREVIPPDWVLDFWNPMEKSFYQEFFAGREQRKRLL